MRAETTPLLIACLALLSAAVGPRCVKASSTADATAAESLAPAPGTIDPRLAAIRRAFNDTAHHPLDDIPAGTDAGSAGEWHVSLFEPPRGNGTNNTNNANYTESFAMALTPVCVAFRPLSVSDPHIVSTVWDFAASLMSAAAADAGPFAGFTFALVDDGAANAAVRAAFDDRGAAGFAGAAGATAWPAAVRANPRVRLVGDEAEANRMARDTAGVLALAPIAFGLGLPCAYMRVTNASYATAFKAQVSESVRRAVDVVPQGASRAPRLRVNGYNYPFVGPMLVSLRDGAAASCAAFKSVYAVALSVDYTARATLQTWSILPLAYGGVEAELQRVVHALQRAGCGAHVPVTRVGGSTAVLEAAVAWSLFWPRSYTSFIEYLTVGSDQANADARSGAKLVATSDYPVTRAQLAADPSFVSVPAVAFALAVVFHVPGESRIKLPRCLLPLLFAGNVTRWDDPRVRAANPATPLPPGMPVRVTAAAPGIGTTLAFLRGLRDIVATCPELAGWDIPLSTTWPFATGEPLQPRTDAIEAHVAVTPGAIGYSSAGSAYQNNAPIADLVDTEDGSILQPTRQSVEAALQLADVDELTHGVAFRAFHGTYPFIGVAYFTLYRHHAHAANCSALRRAVEWMRYGVLSAEGQSYTTKQGFGPIPPRMTAHLERLTDDMRCAGQFVLPRPPSDGAGQSATTLVAAVVVAVAVLAAAGGALLYVKVLGVDPLANAPLDDARPFAVLFVGLANEGQLCDTYTEESVRAAVKRLARLVRAAVRETGCHEAQRVSDGLFMITAKSADAALACAARVAEDVNVVTAWDADLVRAHAAATVAAGRSHAGTTTASVRSNGSSQKSLQSAGGGGSTPTSARRFAKLNDSARRGSPAAGVDPKNVSSDRKSGGAAGTSRERKSMSGSHAAGRSSTSSSRAPPTVLVNVSVAIGFGQIDHDPELRTVAYRGTVVAEAAVAADACVPAMIVVSESVVDTVSEDGLEVAGCFELLLAAGDADRATNTSSTVSASRARHHVYTPLGYGAAALVQQGLQRQRQEKRHAGGGGDGGNVGSVAAELLRKENGVAQRRCAVAAVLVPSLADHLACKADAAPAGQRLRRITEDVALLRDLAGAYRCHVHDIVGSSVVVTANAVGAPVAAPLPALTAFARAATSELSGSGAAAGVAGGTLIAGLVDALSVAGGDLSLAAAAASCAASDLGLPCLCGVSRGGLQELSSRFECTTVDLAQLAAGASAAPLRLVAPVEERDDTNDEWLYNFEGSSDALALEARWEAAASGGSPALPPSPESFREKNTTNHAISNSPAAHRPISGSSGGGNVSATENASNPPMFPPLLDTKGDVPAGADADEAMSVVRHVAVTQLKRIEPDVAGYPAGRTVELLGFRGRALLASDA